ncbi:MAG: translation elongation factor 4 [Candidatus Andersenbacteria bacterium]
MYDLTQIRNFAIIAHVDHGKSTLSDRLIELTGTVPSRSMRNQLLDTLDLERERGITIKLQPVQMLYREAGQRYVLNLIDTPGHVDFSYEVSRTLAAVEGVLLLVDASQGIEAQTLAHAELAVANNLAIIPVINKIDLPNADPERVTQELVHLLGVTAEQVVRVSAKEGTNVAELLKAIVARIPPPRGSTTKPARALIFDSIFDAYRGVIAYVRVFDGVFEADQELRFAATKAHSKSQHVGVFKPTRTAVPELSAGLTGYIETGLKEIRLVRVGDTILSREPAKPLPGYAPSEPKVFAAVFPADPDRYPQLRAGLERLALNDASLSFESIRSTALGAGFRMGFLGLLHLEIVQERLRREFSVEIVSTTPMVPYRMRTNGTVRELQSALELPTGEHTADKATAQLEEPWTDLEIVTPTNHIGDVLQLISQRRGSLTGQEYLDQTRVIVRAHVPLAEVIVGFFDKLKSVTRGYASMHYELAGYKPADVVRLDVLLAGEPVEALTMAVPRERVQTVGRHLVTTLKELVPQQQFAVPIQAAVGGKIVARTTLSARRKDVTAKLYGGDVTRKRKLLEKQKAGKKKLRSMGRVNLPPESYSKLLKIDFSG